MGPGDPPPENRLLRWPSSCASWMRTAETGDLPRHLGRARALVGRGPTPTGTTCGLRSSGRAGFSSTSSGIASRPAIWLVRTRISSDCSLPEYPFSSSTEPCSLVHCSRSRCRAERSTRCTWPRRAICGRGVRMCGLRRTTNGWRGRPKGLGCGCIRCEYERRLGTRLSSA